jgi:drug/metabolite transporter (DMT)-like permease
MTEHPKIKVILGFAAIYIIWGSTYLAIRFAVDTLPPFMMAGLRFVLGGLLFYAWARIGGAEKPQPSHWWPAALIGLLLAGGGTGLVSWAEVTVPSGLTALLVAMVPMWIVLADWVRPGGVRPTRLMVLGLLLGFAGVGLLIDPTNMTGADDIDKFGAFLVIVATISWATGSIYSRHAHQPKSKTVGAGMQMICGGFGLLIASGLTGEFSGFDYGSVTFESWLALGYLITIGSGAFAVYIWLLAASTPAKVATYAYVNPIIALLLGNLLAGEALNVRMVGCSAMIIVAVVIIIMAKAKAEQRLRREAAVPTCQAANGIKA